MKYYVEDSLSNFKFWSGAAGRAAQLTDEQFDQLEAIMDDGMTEWSDTMINDLFWHEPDTIADWLGFKDWEHLEKDVSNDKIKEADDWADNMAYGPTEAELILMAELSGIDNDDLDDCETDEEKEELITGEFQRYWEGRNDFEKVDIYDDYN